MKMIVGLGNPGKEYENTRHNIGFQTIDLYAKKHHVQINKSKFSGLYVDFLFQGEKVILLKPQSYINLSGEVIRRFVNFFQIDIADLIIISDDLDLSIGTFKLKAKGSSGGHNGLKNIELHLKTQNYKRIKIGISNNKKMETKDYVLGNLSLQEENSLSKIRKIVVDIIDDSFCMNFDLLMGKYNTKLNKERKDELL